MKQCPNCATALEDDAMFCLNCGTPISADAPAAVVAPEVPAAPVGAAAPVYEPAPEQPAEKKPLNKKLIGIIAIAAVAVAAIIFVIIGFSTNWFRPPLSKVEDAIEKTMEANSFTFEAEAEIPGQGDFSVEGKLVLDRENQNLSALVDLSMGEGYMTYLIAEGKVYSIQNYDSNKSASIEDIPADAFEQIFKALETSEQEEIDDETLENLIKSAGLKVEVEEVRAFLDSIKEDCFENKAWLEEMLGYEKKDGKYSFDFKVDDVIEDLVNRAYEAEIISKSLKKQLSINTGAKCEIEIVLEKGYIASIEATIEINDMEVYAKVKLSDVNSTVVSEKDISETTDEVNEFIAEYYAKCTECNVQNKKDNMRVVNEKYYCYDCYYDMDYCDICDAFVKEDTLTYIRYYDRCEDCAAEYIAENYVNCGGCGKQDDKNSLYEVGDKYYCYDCYYDRDYCDVCKAFVLDDDLTRYSYTDYCPECYKTYSEEHTCDLCEELTGSNYLCGNHREKRMCDGCGEEKNIYYYNVQSKKHLCLWCY